MPARPLLALLPLVALLALAVPAHAGPTQESQLQDDPLLVYGTPAQVRGVLESARALGVDRVRVTLQWKLVAPAPDSRRRPRFDAADHTAYPAGAWERYDRIVWLAARSGIAVNFNVSAPGPKWAMRRVARRDIQPVYAPSAREFGRFVRAAGTRYPTVDMWSVWNEPNQGAWLAPQWARDRDGWKEWAPQRYRALVDAAWDALQATGHGSHAFLIGELAPTGRDDRGRTRPIKPRRFLRALYCVDRRHRPLRGRSARRRNCPDGAAERRRFEQDHPGLFRATGFAHHPYSLLTAPRRRTRDRDSVAMADLSRLSHDLRRVFRAHRVDRPRLRLYLTEYGFQTDPPDPYGGISPARQAAWLNEADYLAWRRSDVRMVSQFLLRDDAPDRTFTRGSAQYWRTFQTGLLTHGLKPKRSWWAYRMPIHVPIRVKAAGRPFRIWGQVRPPRADAGPLSVELRWRARDGRARGPWRTLTTVVTKSRRGHLQVLRRLPGGSGQVRLEWQDPATGERLRSRAVNVRAR